MTAKLYYTPFIPAYSNTGVALAEAKLYFYYTNTLTLAPIYSDSGLSVALSNPVSANLAGKYPNIYLDSSITYRVRQTDKNGAILDTVDPYVPGNMLKGDKGDTGDPGTVSANSGVTMTPPSVVDNSFSRVLLDQAAPTSGMINSAGGNDAVNARIIFNTGRFTQGPTGHANYYDSVLAFGSNLTTSYTPLNTAMPSCSYRIESKFAQGGASDPFITEFHIASMYPVGSGGEFRAASCVVPHLSSNWDTANCAWGTRAAIQTVTDGLGRLRIYGDYRTGVSEIAYGDGGSGDGHPVLAFATNNKRMFIQSNAAGTDQLALPYLNDRDELYCQRPVLNQISPTLGLLGTVSAFSEQDLSASANTVFRYGLAGAAVTGSYTANKFDANASVNFIGADYSNSTGNTYIDLTCGSGKLAGLRVGGSSVLTFSGTKPVFGGLAALNYADDTAAAAGGVPVGGLYHTSGTVKVRLT